MSWQRKLFPLVALILGAMALTFIAFDHSEAAWVERGNGQGGGGGVTSGAAVPTCTAGARVRVDASGNLACTSEDRYNEASLYGYTSSYWAYDYRTLLVAGTPGNLNIKFDNAGSVWGGFYANGSSLIGVGISGVSVASFTSTVATVPGLRVGNSNSSSSYGAFINAAYPALQISTAPLSDNGLVIGQLYTGAMYSGSPAGGGFASGTSPFWIGLGGTPVNFDPANNVGRLVFIDDTADSVRLADADFMVGTATDAINIVLYDTGTITAVGYAGSGASLTGITTTTFNWSNTPASGDLVTVGSNGQFTAAAPSQDGWLSDSNTWTGLGTSSLTINADMTSKIGPGDKLKIGQSGTKYFYVVSAAYTAAVTTVTIAINADYALSAGAITTPYYSHDASPTGFPDWFNFTTTYGGFSANPTPATIRYKIVGRHVFVRVYPTALGTSNATTFTITVPVTSANQTDGASGYSPWGGAGRCADNSTVKTSPCSWEVPPNGTTVEFYDDAAQSAWTSSGSKGFFVTLYYEF